MFPLVGFLFVSSLFLRDNSVRGRPLEPLPTQHIQQGEKRKNPKEKSKNEKSWPKHPVSDFLLPTNGEKTLAWEAKAKHFTGKKITKWH